MIVIAITLIILLLFYGICTYGAYKFIHCAYSTGGIYEKINIGTEDILMVVCPAVNSLFALDYILGGYKKANKIFNIKR